MHKEGTASKLQRTRTMPRSGPRPFPILNGYRQMLAIALQRAKGRDSGKNNMSGNDKSSSQRALTHFLERPKAVEEKILQKKMCLLLLDKMLAVFFLIFL
jgi:hypothetical protein